MSSSKYRDHLPGTASTLLRAALSYAHCASARCRSIDNTSQTVLLEVYNENWVRRDEFLGQVELRPADFGMVLPILVFFVTVLSACVILADVHFACNQLVV